MTKEVVTQATTEVAAASGLDPALLSRLQTDAGGGLSTAQEDNLVPFIYLLQPLSPQVLKAKQEYIQGAEAGDFWTRNSEPPIISGSKGLVFQPCYFYKELVEWMPDRGGLAGRHSIECLPNISTGKKWTGTLTDVKEVVDEDNPNKYPKYIRSSNNNEIVETRCFVGYVYPEDGRQPMPYVISLSSTGHAFGKSWMTLQNSQSMPNGAKCDKSWVFLYRLKTTMKTNKEGSWYMYTATTERMVKDMAEYERGFILYQNFVSGEKQADYSTMKDEGSASDAAAPLYNDEM